MTCGPRHACQRPPPLFAARVASREVKAAALYCLVAWVSYDDDFPPLMALSDLSSCGLLHLLDRHADLTEAGAHDMLVASRALQVGR